MKSNYQIEDVNVNFDEYFEVERISTEAQSKLSTGDIVVVPLCHHDGEYYFAQETIDFLKFCQQSDLEHSYDILADDDINVLSLHSFDIWMPVIWVAKTVLFPIAIGMVSNYIWEKCKGREDEDAQVDVTVITKTKNGEKSIHYKGDAQTFKEKFKQIDINKM